MLFNSVEFAILFIITYGLYLVLNHKWQNRLLLAASYIFYGSWDYRFLVLMMLSTFIGYQSALLIEKHGSNNRFRRLYLGVALGTDLSILFFFKYSNFFFENFAFLLGKLGFHASINTLHIILPVGVSFYTFQSMSYVLDVYRKEIPAEKNLRDFALFISFFPQLVAGPIERAGHLLSQIKSKRQISYNHVYEGTYLIFWGLFQKIYIADNLGKIADAFFESSLSHQPLDSFIGVYAFAFQILCDFSGYSDMARGLAKVMGFELMVNFNYPYFASNPGDFWNRWHISLSRWFRDYVYIPLGGNKKGLLMTLRNLAVTMFLAGLWHGARWTYVVWGLYHGFLLLAHRITEKIFQGKIWIKKSAFLKIWHAAKIIAFFHLICVGWVFFRAHTIQQAVSIILNLFNLQDLSLNCLYSFTPFLQWTWIFLIIHYFQFKKNDAFVLWRLPAILRGVIYFTIYYICIAHGVKGGKEFIYFQF